MVTGTEDRAEVSATAADRAAGSQTAKNGKEVGKAEVDMAGVGGVKGFVGADIAVGSKATVEAVTDSSAEDSRAVGAGNDSSVEDTASDRRAGKTMEKEREPLRPRKKEAGPNQQWEHHHCILNTGGGAAAAGEAQDDELVER